MKVEVHLRNKETGETGIYLHNGWLNRDGEFDDYIWSEGANACDHNRAMFLYPDRDTGDEDWECGYDNIIEITKIVDCETDKIVYQDDWYEVN